MRRIEIKASFDCGTISTTREADTLEDAINQINADFPALNLTTASVTEWKFLDQGEQAKLF